MRPYQSFKLFPLLLDTQIPLQILKRSWNPSKQLHIVELLKILHNQLQLQKVIQYNIINTQMNRKSLDELTSYEGFCNALLNKSVSSVQLIHAVPTSTAAQYYQQYPSISIQQNQLKRCLAQRIKVLAELFQLTKVKSGQFLNHSIQIFDEMTDLIDTSSKKYQFSKKSVRRHPLTSQTTDPFRPQDKYQGIRPAQFSNHTHQMSLQNIRVDNIIQQSKSILQPFVYVDNLKEFNEMLHYLNQQKQIAVDLEHSNKSYQGITCLIQISSRDKDFIIDVFPLWMEIPRLSSVIGNPAIIKVMHGAEMDVKWLQRDYNIHIINLFDTYKASRVLGFPKLSYAYLLNNYCHVDTDKSYQTADWRIRPLSQQMLHYARTDTHYLLEIFDRIRSDLTIKATKINLEPITVIKNIYETSHQTTLSEVQLFSYPKMEIYQNLKYQMSTVNFHIVQKIFWAINESAMQFDQFFYDVISKKTLLEVLAVVKDLIYNKISKVSKVTRIDKALSLLKKSKFIGIGELIAIIKVQLEQFFINEQQTEQDYIQSLKKNNKQKQITKKHQLTNVISKNMDVEHQCQFQRIKCQSDFFQYGKQSYEHKVVFQNHLRHYQPILTFVASKYGIQPIHNEEQKQQEIQNNKRSFKEEVQCEEKQNDKMIKFQKMKQDVIYAIEDPDRVQQQIKPKKKRKQEKYQQKVRGRRGNIYEYLADN